MIKNKLKRLCCFIEVTYFNKNFYFCETNKNAMNEITRVLKTFFTYVKCPDFKNEAVFLSAVVGNHSAFQDCCNNKIPT